MDPLHKTDFASERYFRKLKQLNENAENVSSSAGPAAAATVSPLPPLQASTFTLPLGQQRSLDNEIPISLMLRPSDQKKRSLGHDLTTLRTQRRPIFTGSFGALYSKVTAIQKPPSIVKQQYENILADDPTAPLQLTMGDCFLSLPNELQVRIITLLPIHTIFTLRLVSKSFHTIVTVNETLIAHYHVANSLPAYTLRLYPLPDPTHLSLHYLCSIWHRLHVAFKLSTMISSQATKEIFLRTTEAQRLEFQSEYRRMRQRLVPLVFTLFHFFETYRDLHVQHLTANGTLLKLQPFTLNPIESQVMAMYDDQTLLKVHQVFPLVISSFSRRLRPPSYAGRLNRTIKGYLKDRPPDEVYATILVIGGLGQAQRFWEIEGYNARRAAVDIWYGFVTRSPVEAPPKSKMSLITYLGRENPNQAVYSEAARHDDTSCQEWFCVKPTCQAARRRNSTDNLVFHSSLSAGPPMSPLSREQLRLLLPDLPPLASIWMHTAEALILQRKIVERPQDIKRNTQVLLELIRADGMDGMDGVDGVDGMDGHRIESLPSQRGSDQMDERRVVSSPSQRGSGRMDGHRIESLPSQRGSGRMDERRVVSSPTPSESDRDTGFDNAASTTYDNKSSIFDRPEVVESTLPTIVSAKPEEVEDLQDAQTIGTDNQSLDLPITERDRLVSDIAGKIWTSTATFLDLREGLSARISAALPDLLKEFSQELSVSAQPGIQRGAVTFLRHYRKYITRSFQSSAELAPSDSEMESQFESEISDQLTVDEKMSRWNVTAPENVVIPEITQERAVIDAEDGALRDAESDAASYSSGDFDTYQSIPKLDQAWNFVFGSQAFTRLQTSIRTAACLTPRKGHTIYKIRETILNALNSRTNNMSDRSLTSLMQSSLFQISWNPVAFLAEQYDDGLQTQLREVVTLSGSATDAQALSCGEYVEQVWSKTGLEILDAIQAVMIHPERSQNFNISDGTKLNIQLSDGQLLVDTIGSILSLADIGEELAWLGAACRASGFDDIIGYSTVQILMKSPMPSFTINFQLEDVEAEERAGNGTCWHHLFKNPVIAKGFPILARDHDEKGLEISPRMMAELGGADRVTVFGDQLLIKGFSTMFVPTERIHGSILWHFLFNKNNDARISYSLAKDKCPKRAAIDQVNFSCLASTRTFLGWASSAHLYTGSSTIDYEALRYTGSNFTSAGCALEKVTISGGKFLSAGATFAPGKKDSRLVLSSSGPYILQMHAASRMKVVLYDTSDRRGWLVDGANALLHLTRAQLSRKPYSDSDLLDLSSFPHANLDKGHESALEALKAIAARNLPLFEDEPDFGQSSSAESKWGIKSVVLNIWHVLEQIQDHQTELTGPGMPIQLTNRDKLEGFGFVDIISGGTSIRPRVATLEPSGRGWVDFTREIQAITLMARGFGDIIGPAKGSNGLCVRWEQVPKGKDYLVARVRHLQEICEEFGDLQSRPLELVRGLYWHQGGELFEDCHIHKCQSNCDRVQVLVPKITLGSKKTPDPFQQLDGAVIFGRSNRLCMWWPKNPRIEPKADLAACQAEDSKEDSSSSLPHLAFHDSGVGTSRGPSDDAQLSIRSQLLSRQYSDQSMADLPGQRFMSGALSLPICHQCSSSSIIGTGTHQTSSADSPEINVLTVQPSAKSRKGKERVKPTENIHESTTLAIDGTRTYSLELNDPSVINDAAVKAEHEESSTAAKIPKPFVRERNLMTIRRSRFASAISSAGAKASEDSRHGSTFSRIFQKYSRSKKEPFLKDRKD